MKEKQGEDSRNIKEYLLEIMKAEKRKEELEKARTRLRDIDRDVEEHLKANGLQVIKDAEKADKCAEGMQILADKIDEAEGMIEINSVYYAEASKSMRNLKQTKERIKTTIEALRALKVVVEEIEKTENLSARTMLQIDREVNTPSAAQKEIENEPWIRGVYEWVEASKRIKHAAKTVGSHSLARKIRSFKTNNEDRLKTVAKIMAQFWITDITGALSRTEDTGRVEERVGERKARAKKNRVFMAVSKYIYEEIDRAEEYVEYINSARRREIGKIEELSADLNSTLRFFVEYLKVDKEIRKALGPNDDVVTEEYVEAMKKKIEHGLEREEQPDKNRAEEKEEKHKEKDGKSTLNILQEFLTRAHAYGVNTRDMQETLVQAAYYGILRKQKKAEAKVEAKINEKKETEEKLKEVLAVIASFYNAAKEVTGQIEQAENELDEITLKSLNEILKHATPFFSTLGLSDAKHISSFLEAVRSRLDDDADIEQARVEEKVPELKKIREAEESITSNAEKDFKQVLDDVVRQIRIQMEKITEKTEVTVFASKVSALFQAYHQVLGEKKTKEDIEKIFQLVSTYILSLKTYSQVYALENEFAVLYKSMQVASAKSKAAERLLKIFTQIDQIRKNKHKNVTEPVETDLQDVYARIREQK